MPSGELPVGFETGAWLGIERRFSQLCESNPGRRLLGPALTPVCRRYNVGPHAAAHRQMDLW